MIAGTICDWLAQQQPLVVDERVLLMGRVDHIDNFYREIEIAINPVVFGSGLKIKTVEALQFGKTVLTTQHGMIGLEGIDDSACRSVECVENMADELLNWRVNREPSPHSADQSTGLPASITQPYAELEAYLGER